MNGERETSPVSGSEQQRSGDGTLGSSGPGRSSSPAAVQAKLALHGKTFDEQVQMLAPARASVASGTPVQKDATGTPSGRGECTLYGDYWVVPDASTTSFPDAVGEQITESEYAKLKGVWEKLNAGSGGIKIEEKDSAGTERAGFKTMVLGQFGKLLSKPVGRGLVAGLVAGSTVVTIRPSSSQIYGGANAIRGGAGTLEKPDGSAGAGGTTIVQIDYNLKDSDVKVFDKGGAEISLPVFVTLGHELIHAKHNAAGRNRRDIAATDAAYSNKEEEETIATGDLTENDIRGEHGLTLRHGHGGRDTRTP